MRNKIKKVLVFAALKSPVFAAYYNLASTVFISRQPFTS
jgi:hypothetical protein